MAFTVALPPVITGHAPSESQRRGPAHKHVARNGDSTTAVRLIWSTDGQGGETASVATTRAQVDRTPRFLLSRAYPMAMAHESRRAIDQRRWATGDKQGRNWDLFQLNIYCTMVISY